VQAQASRSYQNSKDSLILGGQTLDGEQSSVRHGTTKIILWVLLPALAWISSACQAVPDRTQTEGDAAPPITVQSPASETGAPPVAGPAVSTPSASAQPTARPVRTELAATDPATVNLASGKPTLVDFFAFW
jgi:hypothetical protein